MNAHKTPVDMLNIDHDCRGTLAQEAVNIRIESAQPHERPSFECDDDLLMAGRIFAVATFQRLDIAKRRRLA